MHFSSAFLAAALAAVPALAFTNGTLVPAYICNPVNDGMPKSFGQLLQLTREQTPTVAFSSNAGQNVKAPQLQQTGTSKIGNSAYILASLHDSPNNINTQQQSLVVKPQTGSTIVAGQANKITISTKDNSQLKGALLYGQDGSGTRQGSFTDANGGPFVPFPGCGKNPQGGFSGVIQQTGVTAQSSYSSLVYNAPACVPGGNITIGGLSVTGSGFGIWTYSFQVTGSTCGGNTGATGSTGKTGNGQKGTTGGNTGSAASSSGAKGAASSGGAKAAVGNTTVAAAAATAAASPSTSAAAAGKGKGKGGWKHPTTFTKVAQKAQTTCTH